MQSFVLFLACAALYHANAAFMFLGQGLFAPRVGKHTDRRHGAGR